MNEGMFAPTNDPSFLLIEEGYSPLREREIESLFTVGNGYLGTRGSLEEQEPTSDPATLIAGVYDRGTADSIEELVVIPDWLFTRVYVEDRQLTMSSENAVEHRRILDMKKGVVSREWRHRDESDRITMVRFTHFASLADPHALVLSISVVPVNYRGEIRVETGIKPCQKCLPLELVDMSALDSDGGVLVTAKTRHTSITVSETQLSVAKEGPVKPEYHAHIDGAVGFEQWRWHSDIGQPVTIEKFVSIYTSRESDNPVRDAGAHVRELASHGIDMLLREHVSAWERRWETASIVIEEDAEAQRWVNFAAYQLIIADDARDERVSISARALTGTVYKGHIFWDTEMFILPFFIYTHPECARAMLMYRYHTLPAARRKAEQIGYKGALFAWESTITGDEMTPPFVLAPTGEVITILSGKLEHHINAAIAYGVWSYWNATLDADFLVAAGAEILIEIARFWASRVEKRDNAFHIYNVEGPDEYHEDVNDNIYTNMMAAWSLRRAVDAVRYIKESHYNDWLKLQNSIDLDILETDRWIEVADNIYKDIVHSSNLIEQFDGYFDLHDIDVEDYEPRTAALDVILGREKTAASQLVKQADVVMILYLLEDELSEEIIRKNFEYYDQRTAHSSSLCPSIYGLVAARLGLMDTAMRYFHKAGQIDLANNMGNASGGVHAAALGGLWQQVVMGFAGGRVSKEGISIYPRLPAQWKGLKFSLQWRDIRLHFDVERDRRIKFVTEGKGTFKIGIYGRALQELLTGPVYVANWEGNTWHDFVEMD